MSRDADTSIRAPTGGVRPQPRVVADERAAEAARACYRAREMKTLPADGRIGPLLEPGERVVAVHRSAVLDRREPPVGNQITAGLTGTLYLTSRRLVLVGGSTVAIELDAVEEVVLSGERLRFMLHEGRGVTVEVTRPRLLRVQTAAARAAARVVAVG
jgi:hypothetical protein